MDPCPHCDRKYPVSHHQTWLHMSQFFDGMSKETTFNQCRVGRLTYTAWTWNIMPEISHSSLQNEIRLQENQRDSITTRTVDHEQKSGWPSHFRCRKQALEVAKSIWDEPQVSFFWKSTRLARILMFCKQQLFNSQVWRLPVDFCKPVYNHDSLLILAFPYEVPRALQKPHRETHSPK